MKQIETSRLPDPIMRRPRADREEKRATHANEMSADKLTEREQLDSHDPNQRRLSETTGSIHQCRSEEVSQDLSREAATVAFA